MHTAPGVTLAELHKLMYPGLANVISIQRGHLPAAGQVWRALLIASTSR